MYILHPCILGERYNGKYIVFSLMLSVSKGCIPARTNGSWKTIYFWGDCDAHVTTRGNGSNKDCKPLAIYFHARHIILPTRPGVACYCVQLF